MNQKDRAGKMPDNLKELMTIPLIGPFIGGAVLVIARILGDPKAGKWTRIGIEVPTLWALTYMGFRGSYGVLVWLGLPPELAMTIAYATALTGGHFGTNWIREAGKAWSRKYFGMDK